MNDTAQETTTAMAVFVEHEVLGASLLPVEGKSKINCNCTTSHISCTNSLTSEMYIDEAIIYYWNCKLFRLQFQFNMISQATVYNLILPHLWVMLYHLVLFQSVCQLVLGLLVLSSHTPLGRDLGSTSHLHHTLSLVLME